MYLLVDAGAAYSIRCAAQCGWRMVDIRSTLELIPIPLNPSGAVLSGPEDIPDAVRIARKSHRLSRFYADGNFSAGACDSLFEKWPMKCISLPVKNRRNTGARANCDGLFGRPPPFYAA